VIKYTYRVLESEYKSGFIIDTFRVTRDVPAKNIKNFPAGTTLPVRYKPQKPSQSVTPYDQVRPFDLTNPIVILFIGLVWVAVYFLPPK
jgi:hypothetical protein